MWLCMMMLEIACGFAPQFPDQIFADGADGMYISTDRPANMVWSIDSTNHNAAFVTSSTYLSDGKISTPTRMTWDVGAQTSANEVFLTVSGLSLPVAALEKKIFALFCPLTQYAIPEGVLVQITMYDATEANFISTGLTSLVALDNGATAVIALTSNSATPFVIDHIKVFIENNIGSHTTWATSGQIFDIGEIWFGSLTEFKNTTDPKRKLVDNVTNRRSHNLTNQPLFGGATFYQWTYGLTPMSNSAAYSGSTVPTYSQVEFALSQAKAALIIGRIYTPGTTTIDQASINYSTAFGRPATDGLRELQAHKDGPLWTAGLVFETQSAG
jgi:hypothetical protein